ncbi:hypothetical protein O181_033476 [Austropuccinia psidii MF-1]|uniref:Uncharacterized protein n=1 Tax=Austropuccinia psidii MF-1 TaxID=1389203 RepID=A0A9Q3D4I0_9BASI|nr:hypothetical protein [Austropuccinia psidii MF-1]
MTKISKTSTSTNQLVRSESDEHHCWNPQKRVKHLDKARLKVLTENLRIRLNYAKLKVVNGWQDQTFKQVVKNLYLSRNQASNQAKDHSFSSSSSSSSYDLLNQSHSFESHSSSNSNQNTNQAKVPDRKTGSINQSIHSAIKYIDQSQANIEEKDHKANFIQSSFKFTNQYSSKSIIPNKRLSIDRSNFHSNLNSSPNSLTHSISTQSSSNSSNSLKSINNPFKSSCQKDSFKKTFTTTPLSLKHSTPFKSMLRFDQSTSSSAIWPGSASAIKSYDEFWKVCSVAADPKVSNLDLDNLDQSESIENQFLSLNSSSSLPLSSLTPIDINTISPVQSRSHHSALSQSNLFFGLTPTNTQSQLTPIRARPPSLVNSANRNSIGRLRSSSTLISTPGGGKLTLSARKRSLGGGLFATPTMTNSFSGLFGQGTDDKNEISLDDLDLMNWN